MLGRLRTGWEDWAKRFSVLATPIPSAMSKNFLNETKLDKTINNVPHEIGTSAFPRDTTQQLEKLIFRYAKTGRPIAVSFRSLVSWIKVGERATHYLHPYPAKLLPQIAHFFLSSDLMCPKNGSVLDPFGGTGTVALEARLSGRKAWYADCNPLARLVADAKLSAIPAEECDQLLIQLTSRLNKAPENLLMPNVINIRHWYSDKVIRELTALKHAVELEPHPVHRRYLMVTFSAVARKMSRADPRLSVPVRMDPKALRNVAAKRGTVWEAFVRQFEANRRRMSELVKMLPATGDFAFAGIDARKLSTSDGSQLPSNSIDLILTSPPYAGAQKYVRAASLSLGWLGIAGAGELKPLENLTIGREHLPANVVAGRHTSRLRAAETVIRKIDGINPYRAAICATYLDEMDSALKEAARVLSPGGHLVIVVGNNKVCGIDFRSSQYLRELAESHGLSLRMRLIDEIKSRGLMTKRNKTASVITREWVLVLQKALN